MVQSFPDDSSPEVPLHEPNLAISQWPIPTQRPRVVRDQGLWPKLTTLSWAVPASALVAIPSLAWMTYVALLMDKPLGLLIPGLSGAVYFLSLLRALILARQHRTLLKEGLIIHGELHGPAIFDAGQLWHVRWGQRDLERLTWTENEGAPARRDFITRLLDLFLRPTLQSTAAEHLEQVRIDGHPEMRSLVWRDPLTALVHPRNPSLTVIPALHNIQFEPVIDRRPDELNPEAHSDPVGGPAERFDLMLHEDRALFWDRPKLLMSAEGLSLMDGGVTIASVVWSRPIAVQLSAWLLNSEQVELTVTVRQRGERQGKSVSFSVALPHEQVSRRVPIQQSKAPRLSRSEDFVVAWRALSWHCAMHSDTLPCDVNLSQEARKPEAVVDAFVQSSSHHRRWFASGFAMMALAFGTWFGLDFMDAERAATRGCREFDAASCLKLGELLDVTPSVDGVSREVDGERILSAYSDACSFGSSRGCLRAGDILRRGRGVASDAERMLSFYDQACALDQGAHCFDLGYVLSNGVGVPRDRPRALQAYEQACADEHEVACFNLGLMIQHGYDDVPLDYERSAALHKASCEKHKNMAACYSLGWLYESGKGVAKDEGEAASLYKRACDGGDMMGCRAYGVMLQHGRGVTQDLEAAVTQFREACHENPRHGCRMLGEALERGHGVKVDHARALKVYKKSCKAGVPSGCASAGYLLLKGDPALRDEAMARRFFEGACHHDHAYGCAMLGYIVDRGIGGEQDKVQGNVYHRRACEGGNASACNSLGFNMEKGYGAERDDVEAVALYERACELMYGLACANLGRMAESGHGREKDVRRAAEHYRQACDLDVMRGCHNLANLVKRGDVTPGLGESAAELFLKACVGGYERSCGLGVRVLKGSVTP